MKPKQTLKKLKTLEKEYSVLKNQLRKQPILQAKNNHYLSSDKEEFKALWEKYTIFFRAFQKLIKKTKYRKFFIFRNFNNLVLKKYMLRRYFNILWDILESFWEHEEFLRMFLSENFKKDYWKIARFIYRPWHIKVLNTPNIFITPFQDSIHKKIFSLLDSKEIQFNSEKRIFTNYENIYFYLKNRADKVIYFCAKRIGLVIASTRFTRRTHWLISQENLNKYLNTAKPWDIFLTRWNWNASNISIPGFWKHMSLYLGNGEYIKKLHKKNIIHLQNIKSIQRSIHYIIEATDKWILIKPIAELVAHNDYLWVARTSFTNASIEKVIAKAISNEWKWYDYRFNYYSDRNLVCSELVLKSYAPDHEGDEWIQIELEQIWVSLSYPPNKFIQKIFSDKNIKPVFFIDAIEKTGESIIKDPQELEKSGKRSRFSFMLK